MRAIGIDTGGTFTDFVVAEKGELRVFKIPSTPDDPARAVLDGLERLGVRAGAGDATILHGSTVATNALLERRGARIALVTTAGFRDVLEIGRQDRPRLYDLEVSRPEPLVPRERRLEVDERTLHDGSILRPLGRESVARLVRQVARLRCESVAVCLLFSYANPEHERRLTRALRGAGLHVSPSFEVLPEYREYERTATTAADATLAPVVGRYLARLGKRVGDHAFVMQSNGGLVRFDEAATRAVHTVFSGPAAGVIGALEVARAAGFPSAMTLDMGGTSTDVSLARGEPRTTSEFVIGGVPLRVPILDVHTVGAGGGSIAWLDDGGALRVGPRSAGAVPGPASYGHRNGIEATVTDAHVVLGRILPDRFLGGTQMLRGELAVRAIARLARRAGLAPEAAALGILTIVEANMERALKVISVERGFDPRDFSLVAFGGAGPLHAASLAKALGAPRAIVPRDPGALAARGLLGADAVRDVSRTVLLPETRASVRRLRASFHFLEREAVTALRRQGFPSSRIRVERFVDVRYEGQSFELTVPFDLRFRACFDALHEQRYGHADEKRAIEVVTLRVTAKGRLRHSPPSRAIARRRRPKPVSRARALVGARRFDLPVYDRADLGAGARLRGPLLVTEYSATTFVPEGHEMHVDRAGNLILESRGRTTAAPARRRAT